MLETAYFAIAVPLAESLARTASRSHPKIRAVLAGRREPKGSLGCENGIRLWFHVSSLGEFEQARPIIEAVQARRPARVWASFFSPSGLEHARGYAAAADLFYLPFRRVELRRAFDIIRPEAIVVVRYDLWPGMAWEASRRHIPLLLVDATLPPTSPRTRSFLRPMQRSFYRHLTRVLAANPADAARLSLLCGPGVPVEVAGDSRYDRVWARAKSAKSLGGLDNVLREAPGPILVAGSTYEPEERILVEALNQSDAPVSNLRLVVVPHEPTEARLAFAESLFASAGWRPRRLSTLAPGDRWHLLLLDQVGVLAECYRHADFVMVGGSFKGKVHNVMEPAAWGKPIVVGPHYANSPEALEMVDRGAILVAQDAAGVAGTIRGWMEDPHRAAGQGSLARDFLASRLGASERIADAIEEELSRSGPSARPS